MPLQSERKVVVMIPFDQLVAIMARLRSENGCPWDREQTHESLRPYLIEEAYEVLDAIEQQDDVGFREELGDLLLQIVFHAQLAREGGRFTIDDVISTVVEKLIRRHPHVFGDVEAKTADQVLTNWEKIKHTEGGQQRKSVLEGIPSHLPALLKAYRVQEKVARVGFDWRAVDGVFEKVQEEIEEFRKGCAAGDRDQLEEELGDLLFSLVNLARHLQVSPEDALRWTIQKFIDRFQYVEATLHLNGESLDSASLERMDALWDEAKRREDNMEATQDMLAAVKAGDVARVKDLLKHNPALVHTRTEAGDSALLLAIYYGRVEVVEALLDRGAELNIFEAAAVGNVERVTALLEEHPDLVRSYSHDGWTPLHLAAFFGHRDVADVLLDRKADVNAKRDGDTPLTIAESKGFKELAVLLRQYGATG